MDQQRDFLTDEELAVFQAKRKETAIRGGMSAVVVLIGIVMLFMMDINNVLPGSQQSFRMIAMSIFSGLWICYVYPVHKGISQFLKQYPEYSQRSPLKEKVPEGWVRIRVIGILLSTTLLTISFLHYFHPRLEPKEYVPLPAISPFGQNNLPDVEESSE